MHVSHTKSFNIPVSIALATLAHMINVYEMCLSIRQTIWYSICKILDIACGPAFWTVLVSWYPHDVYHAKGSWSCMITVMCTVGTIEGVLCIYSVVAVAKTNKNYHKRTVCFVFVIFESLFMVSKGYSIFKSALGGRIWTFLGGTYHHNSILLIPPLPVHFKIQYYT